MKRILPILFLVFAASASAHSTGQSFEKIEGDYKVDVGINETGTIEASEPVRFSYELYSSKDNSAIEFTDVWVLIRMGKVTMFSGNIHSPVSGLLPTMNYAFAQAGEHELTVRYMKDNTKLVEATFTLPVAGTSDKKESIIFGAVGLVVGLLASLVIKKKT